MLFRSEGATSDRGVLRARARDARNLITLLLLAQGVPMLLAGDEMGRSQRGNNNAWCQDDETSWVDWSQRERHAGLLRFVRELVAFRRAHPALRRRTFLRGVTARGGRPDVAWHGTELRRPDFGPQARILAMHLAGEHAPEPDDDIYLAVNGSEAAASFALPAPPPGRQWLRVVATWEASPRDVLARGEEQPVPGPAVMVAPHSCLVLRSS